MPREFPIRATLRTVPFIYGYCNTSSSPVVFFAKPKGSFALCRGGSNSALGRQWVFAVALLSSAQPVQTGAAPRRASAAALDGHLLGKSVVSFSAAWLSSPALLAVGAAVSELSAEPNSSETSSYTYCRGPIFCLDSLLWVMAPGQASSYVARANREIDQARYEAEKAQNELERAQTLAAISAANAETAKVRRELRNAQSELADPCIGYPNRR